MQTQVEETRPLATPSYSTYWMPLDEPRHMWASFGTGADLSATLLATAHAFFALAHETKALRQFGLGVEQEQHRLFAHHAGYWYGQAEQALCEATRHWSRAAYELDVLVASDGLCLQGGLEEVPRHVPRRPRTAGTALEAHRRGAGRPRRLA